MATMASNGCIARHGFYSFKCILQRRFFYSTSTTAATMAESPISTAPNSPSSSSLTSYLVGSLGFSEKQALSTSAMLNKFRESRGAAKVSGFNFSKNADLVVSFLHQQGFTKPKIRNLVSSVPQILTCKVEQTLEPKMKIFQELGVSVFDFANVLSIHPRILSDGLHSTIRPAIEALRDVMASDENAVRVIKRLKWYPLGKVGKHLVCNVSLLRARGIPIKSIRKHLLQVPPPFMRNPEVFEDLMAQAEEKWGLSPRSPMFLYALSLLCRHSQKNIESKCRVFESSGWDKSQVVNLFRRNPTCFAVSEEKIKAKLSFFMNELGYDPGYILAHPALLNYSLDKRVLPRHRVFQILKEKGLIREDLALSSALTYVESKFLSKFILPFHDSAPNLLDIYVNRIGSSGATDKSKTTLRAGLTKCV